MSQAISIGDLVSSLAYLVICVVGLVGNLLAIYVIIRYTRMKTVTNLYILNLSISDAIFLLDLPLIIVGGLLKRWIFGVVLCKVYFATTGINMFTGSFTLAVLSGDRYLAVCHPSKAVVYRTVRNARIVILLTWIISVILLTPIIAYANIFPQYSPGNFTANFSAITASSSSPLPLSPSHLNIDKWNLIYPEMTTPSLINSYYKNEQQKIQQEKRILPPHHRPLLYANPYRSQVYNTSQSPHVTSATIKRLPQQNKRLKRQQEGTNVNMQFVSKVVLANLSSTVVVTKNVKHSTKNHLQPAKRWSGSEEKIKTVLDKTFETTTAVNDKNDSTSTLQTINSPTYTCTIDWPSSYMIPNAYIAYTMVIGFIIPVLIISFLYTTLVIKLSKDPTSSSPIAVDLTSASHITAKESFPQRMKRTFLSKESSFGKQSDMFKNSLNSKQTSSPKTPTIPENQVLLYRTPPEVLKNIGHRSGDEEKIMHEKEENKINKTNDLIKSHETKTEISATSRPLSVTRNISAFKQRRMQQPRITRLVTSIILVYVVCWLPYWAFQLHLLTNMTAIRESRWKLSLYHLFTFLSYCNSAINPILYVFTNQNFRDSFVGAVQCKKDLGPGSRVITGRYKHINNNKKTNSCKARLEKQNGVTRRDLKRFNSCSAAVTHIGDQRLADVICASNEKVLQSKRGNLFQNYAGQLSLQETRKEEDVIIINTSSSVQPVEQKLVSDEEMKKGGDVTESLSAREEDIVERNLINTNCHVTFEEEKNLNLKN